MKKGEQKPKPARINNIKKKKKNFQHYIALKKKKKKTQMKSLQPNTEVQVRIFWANKQSE
jgi:hypothetical protein